MPNVNVPNVNVPNVNVPNVNGPCPGGDINVAACVPGNINVPNVNLPNVPGNVNVPNVNVPNVNVDVPDVADIVPDFNVPDVADIVPDFNVPKVDVPNVNIPRGGGGPPVAVAAVGSGGQLGIGSARSEPPTRRPIKGVQPCCSDPRLAGRARPSVRSVQAQSPVRYFLPRPRQRWPISLPTAPPVTRRK